MLKTLNKRISNHETEFSLQEWIHSRVNTCGQNKYPTNIFIQHMIVFLRFWAVHRYLICNLCTKTSKVIEVWSWTSKKFKGFKIVRSASKFPQATCTGGHRKVRTYCVCSPGILRCKQGFVLQCLEADNIGSELDSYHNISVYNNIMYIIQFTTYT